MRYETVKLIPGQGSYRLTQLTTGPTMKEQEGNDDACSSNRRRPCTTNQGTTGSASKRQRSDTHCHQCHMNNKVIILRCNKCWKGYCKTCIDRWYPAKEASSSESCPSCCGICNCGACLQSAPCMDLLNENLKRFEDSDALARFQKGCQPIMVDNVLDRAYGLSWEPSMSLRAFLISSRNGNNVMDVMNCLNWSEEKIQASKFFHGYIDSICEGHSEPQILRSVNWPSPGRFKEQLPSHYAEVMRCLPVKHHSYQGLGCLDINVKRLTMCVTYGPNGEVSQGGALTELQRALSDRVSILMHIGATSHTSLQLSNVDESQRSNVSMNSLEGFVDPKVGCVWEIFVKEDIPKLEEYLQKHFGLNHGHFSKN